MDRGELDRLCRSRGEGARGCCRNRRRTTSMTQEPSTAGATSSRGGSRGEGAPAGFAGGGGAARAAPLGQDASPLPQDWRLLLVELADEAQREEGAHVLEVRAHLHVDLVPAGV